jgi:hypothetical protein
VTINIPGSLTYVHTLGFNNIHLKLNNNNTLNVGSKNDLSKVELSWPNIGSNASAHRKFTSDRYVYTNINFYTEKYKDWAQEITDGNKVIPIYNFFIGDSMADYNLYIGTGE